MVNDAVMVIAQPCEQEGEFLNVLVDGCGGFARGQQPILEAHHIGLAVISGGLIACLLDEVGDVAPLIPALSGSPR
ncbi:hypothetical protein D3C80_1927480 [compost metagenome]